MGFIDGEIPNEITSLAAGHYVKYETAAQSRRPVHVRCWPCSVGDADLASPRCCPHVFVKENVHAATPTIGIRESESPPGPPAVRHFYAAGGYAVELVRCLANVS